MQEVLFLKTLQHFRVLDPGNKWGEYTFRQRVKPSKDIFPLIVWAIWNKSPSPQINVEKFMDQVELSFLDMDDWENYWRAFQLNLWVLSKRVGAYDAALKTQRHWHFKSNYLVFLLDKDINQEDFLG